MNRTRNAFTHLCRGPAERIPSCPRPKCRRSRRCHTVWDDKIPGRWRCLALSDDEAADLAVRVYREGRALVERLYAEEQEALKAQKIRRRR